jgi:ribosomal protein S12 methylthiotransferase accessory factor
MQPLARGMTGAIPYLVDYRVGIVRRVREVRRTPGAPNFFHAMAEACNTGAFVRQSNFNLAGGAARDRPRAIFKAVGEAVERYCSAIYDVSNLPIRTAGEAEFAVVEPDEFALFSTTQYNSPGFHWVPFTPETPVRWTAARDAYSGDTVYVPAAMTYLPYYYYQGTDDSPIVQPISTGLACHSSLDRATLAGACEVIERDAFLITWQARITPPQIRVETLDDDSYDLVQRFEDTGSSVYLFDLRMDHGVPTVLAVLRNRHAGHAALVFAAAASLKPAEAVQSALEELAHTRRYAQNIKNSMDRVVGDDDYAAVIEQRDHLNLYADHANSHLADFLFCSKVRVEFEALPDLSTGDHATDLAFLTKRVDAIGRRVLVADLTTADVRTLGLAVVRVIIPGFHPLFMGHRTRALGGRRLWEVPQKLGYPGLDAAVGDNPAPHPYP